MKLPNVKCIFLFVFALTLSTSVLASSWNAFMDASTDDAQYFFDADTVVKQGELQRTVWVKIVRKFKADSDGSWATATQYAFSCSKRTLQALSSSIYDKDGVFIKSFTKPADVSAVLPDSVGEAMLLTACTKDFPNNKSEKLYIKLNDNDVFAATKRIVEMKKDAAPQ